MKQVFQADDGTLFEKEIDCEKYEVSIAYKNSLESRLIELECSEDFVRDFIARLELLVIKHNMKGTLINFIKSIGGQDVNT